MREHDRTSAPASWGFRLLLVSYCGLYLTEELPEFLRGIAKLRARCTPRMFANSELVDDWFAKLAHRATGGVVNLGYLDFGRLPRRIRPTLLKGAEVSVVQLSASLTTVVFVCRPSMEATNAFSGLASTDRAAAIDIRRLSLRHGIDSVQSTPGSTCG